MEAGGLMMGLVVVIGILLLLALVLAPFKLYSIDRTLKEILEELSSSRRRMP